MCRSQRPAQVGCAASVNWLCPPSIKHPERRLHPQLWGTDSCQQSSAISSASLLPVCGFTLPPAAELLCFKNPAALCWHLYVVSIPSDRDEPGKFYPKRGGKEGSLHSICCRVCPSTCSVWPSPRQPCSCTNKGGVSSFLLQDWKICSVYFRRKCYSSEISSFSFLPQLSSGQRLRKSEMTQEREQQRPLPKLFE